MNVSSRSVLVLVFVLFCVNLRPTETQMLRKEAYQSVPELISAAGYPGERHRVRTSDGYGLQVHRIPAGRRSARRAGDNAKGKRPVLLVHGLFGSSGDFLIMGPDRSLGYILADAGYDVWLANLRGNRYSSHQNLTRNDPDFWKYSFQEHGSQDLPATIDKVLNVTGIEKLLYIGYSMGTTSFFTMMCQRPEYNDKIVAALALAPAVYLDNMRQLAQFGLKILNFTGMMRSRGIYSLNPRRDLLDVVVGGVCNVKDAQQDLCMRLIYSVIGEDYEQNDWDMSPIILSRFQPASWGQLEHFGKIAMTGIFTKWENGLSGGVKPYDLKNVRVPVALFYGRNDKLTEKSQIMRLAHSLNETGVLETVQPGSTWPKFNHLDFLFARDVGKLLNRPIVKYVDTLYNKYSTT